MSTIVIMPGGFHPFHAGHYALYQSAKKAFPDAEVYVAATNDMSERPFPFALKEKLAKLAGVEPGHFVQVKNPFQSKEITQNYNPDQDVLIFVRSEKDRNEQPKPGGTKKDGSPAYFQPWTGKDVKPFGQQAYMAYLPTVEFGPGITSATQIRKAWPTLNDKRKTALVMSLYPAAQKNPKLAQTVVGMFDQVMGGQVSEGWKEKAAAAALAGTMATGASGIVLNPNRIIDAHGRSAANPYGNVNSMGHPIKKSAPKPEDDAWAKIEKRKAQEKLKEEKNKEDLFIQADPESDELLRYAQQHYPSAPTKQQAFIKFVQRALKHSKDEDEAQDSEINQLQKEIAQIKQVVNQLQVSESTDYLEEK